MPSSRLITDLLGRNKDYAKNHSPKPFLVEIPKDAKMPHTVICNCADGRVNPEVILGLQPGEAIIIKNAGCNVPRNLADILLLDQITGLEEVLILEHTDCGATHVSEEGLRQAIKKYAPNNAKEVGVIDFGTFKDVEKRARDSVEFIRNNPLVRKELAQNTVGAVYDIKTGKVVQVSD
ncbi:carbonic anhydrase [Xylariales sp. AK1849]|nr:carbonic anhydrase [Xylariales sp. AK1849]